MNGCCGTRIARLVRVGERDVALFGVEQIIESLYLEGWDPAEPALAEAIIERLLDAGNGIPQGQEVAYAGAVLELYRPFHDANAAVRQRSAEELPKTDSGNRAKES